MSAIDPTDYVEAEGPLKFGDEKQQAKFELGVCMAVHKWDELNTAVDNLWGGPNSADKRDWIVGVVVDLFDEKVVDIQLIEETLLYAMFDEFEANVDNDSALEIGALVLKIYKQVAQKDYALVDQLYEKWNARQATRTKTQITVNADPENPDLSDDEEEEEVTTSHVSQGDDAMEVDEPQGPIVDDDGFELVQKKGRRR